MRIVIHWPLNEPRPTKVEVLRPRSKYTARYRMNEIRKQVVDLYPTGMMLKDIAAHVGVQYRTVTGIVCKIIPREERRGKGKGKRA